MVTHEPIMAMKVNDALSVNAPAKKPMVGGPIRKPTKLIVDTAAIAVPADIVFDLPAAL